MKNLKKTFFILFTFVAGALTISSCKEESLTGQELEYRNLDNASGPQRRTDSFLTIRCGVKTSPIPPLPNFYAGIGGDFGGIRTSSITRLQVTCRYISSASGTDQTFTQNNVGFTVTSNTSGSYGASFSLPNYVIGSDRVEVSSIIFGKDNVVLASSGTIVCRECCPY